MIKLFMEHSRMIQERARKFSDFYGLEYDDVQGQAYLIFCQLCRQYDSKKGSFSTFLFGRLTCKLIDYCNEEKRKEHVTIDEIVPIVTYPAYQSKLEFWDSVKSLSKEAQQAIHMLFYPTASTRNWVSKHMLMKEIRKEYGYPIRKIESTFNEISKFVEKEI